MYTRDIFFLFDQEKWDLKIRRFKDLTLFVIVNCNNFAILLYTI